MYGLIGYYGLTRWWDTALTPVERRRVESVFAPMGNSNPRPLTTGQVGAIQGEMATATGLLSSLVGWLSASDEDVAIRRKIRAKLLELVDDEPSLISRHFSLQVLIGEFYRDRDGDPLALAAAIDACRAQIRIAPGVANAMSSMFKGFLPRHVGYEKLAIIHEKAREYEEAIAVSLEAKAAGWGPDWDKRIARCRKRLEGIVQRTRDA